MLSASASSAAAAAAAPPRRTRRASPRSVGARPARCCRRSPPFISRPSARRFSVTKAMPLRMLSRGEWPGSARRRLRYRPVSCGSRPNRMRASSVRPEPIRPKTPSTSPAWRAKLMSATMPARRTPSALEEDAIRGGDRRGGKSWSIGRPTIVVIMPGMSKSLRGPLATSAPSRRMAMSSASRMTSPRMCEM